MRDKLDEDTIDSVQPQIEDYCGYWIYEIINQHWMIEVYAAMYLTIDSTTHLLKARGKVWKKGKPPDSTDYFGEWESEPIPRHPVMMNLFFTFLCYEEYEKDEKLPAPKQTKGVVMIKLIERNSLEGCFQDFQPEREGYGSFRAVRVHKPADTLEEAGNEAFEVFGTPSKRYAEWLARATAASH